MKNESADLAAELDAGQKFIAALKAQTVCLQDVVDIAANTIGAAAQATAAGLPDVALVVLRFGLEALHARVAAVNSEVGDIVAHG